MTALTPIRALRAAVECYGSQSATGRALGVSQNAVSKWLREERHLPAEHVLKVEAETGVSKHDLRPDIYPRDAAALARPAAAPVPGFPGMEPAR